MHQQKNELSSLKENEANMASQLSGHTCDWCQKNGKAHTNAAKASMEDTGTLRKQIATCKGKKPLSSICQGFVLKTNKCQRTLQWLQWNKDHLKSEMTSLVAADGNGCKLTNVEFKKNILTSEEGMLRLAKHSSKSHKVTLNHHHCCHCHFHQNGHRE